jgi:hypothetical protein
VRRNACRCGFEPADSSQGDNGRALNTLRYAPARGRRIGRPNNVQRLQEPAGEAAGLPAGLASGAAAAGLDSAGAADEAAGAEVSSDDLLQAMPAKNIGMRSRMKTLRIALSFVNPR